MPTTYKLVTVNSSPEKAKALLDQVTSQLSDKYEIKLVGNAEHPKDVKKVVEEHKPDVLFTASMWTDEEAEKAVSEAKSVNPSIKTMSLPHGMQKEKGPEAVVEYIVSNMPKVLG